MSLSPGTKLAHYEILEPIGKGGMGDVYHARDEKLRRDVAIKVLPEEFAKDEERLRRFQREARAVAALNHPNIVTIYSVEEDDEIHFITMELVLGSSLREHLTKDGLSFEKFLELAVPIVEALSAAHRKGITHRDLKPQNVMVGNNGRIKVLDFGLAKIVVSSLDDGLDSALPTESRTREGTIVGTIPYMSPEQVEGRSADPRSDVFSLGVLLYEMATGRRPFRGESAIATLSSILKDDPVPVKELRPEFPESVSAIIGRCLAKEPNKRYQHGDELHKEIGKLGSQDVALDSAGRDREAEASKREPFVGRQSEQDKLAARLDEATRGNGALILIGGEPGVGKTRLAEELLADASARSTWTWVGHCYEEGAAPYSPFVEILEQMTREMPRAELREALGDAAPDVARLVPEFRRAFSDIPEPMELPPEQQRRHLFNGILALFERLSAARPVAMLLDDLHWGDDATLALLEHVTPHLKSLAVLVLGTYRDVELDVGKPFEKSMATLVRQTLAERLSLKRLPEAAVADLLEALGGVPPPKALVHVIFNETEGNPFFVGEVFEHLSEEGKLFDEAGAWKEDARVDELDVPEGVRLVIGRRLERLSESTPKLLTAAAIFGRRFDVNVVEAVSGLHNIEGDAFLDALEEAETAKLISPVASGRETVYAFTHELIRHTLMGALSLPRRQRLHLRIADAIEQAYANELEARASDLAHHLYQAGSAADLTKTLRYLALTADAALASGAPEEALAACERALALDENDQAGQKAWLLFKRGLALRALGEWQGAASDWEDALPFFEQAGEGVIVGQICYDLAYNYLWENRLADALKNAERGLKTVGEETSATHCRLLAIAATAHEMDDEFARGLELSDRAVAMAEALGDERLLGGEALFGRMFLFAEHMMLTDLQDVTERAIELTTRSGSPWDLSSVLGLAQLGWIYQGQFALVEQKLEEIEALSVREGNLGSLFYVMQAKCVLALARGRLDDAKERATELIDFCNDAQFPWVSMVYSLRGMVELWQGALSDASKSFAEAVRISPGGAWEGEVLGCRLVGMAYSGEAVNDAHLETLRDGLPRLGEKTGLGRWTILVCMIESLAHVGRNDEAGELYPLVRTMLERGSVWTVAGLVEKAAGIAAASAQKWEEAQKHFETAFRQAEELPHRIEQAEVRRWHARMLLDRNVSDDSEKARELLGEALTLYKELGMPKHVEIVETLL